VPDFFTDVTGGVEGINLRQLNQLLKSAGKRHKNISGNLHYLSY
jgi:hypothetical protein